MHKTLICYKPDSKYRLQLIGRLVYDCTQILRVISTGDINVNKIVKKSGLYKKYVYNAIKTLEKGRLVKELKYPNHKQIRLKSLTELGKEIADMAVSIDFYKKSHGEMLKIIRKYFEIQQGIDSKALKSILTARGWNAEETQVYPHCIEGISYIMQHSGMIFKDGLFRWSIDLLSEFDPLSEIAKSIINNLITEAISYQISVLLGTTIEKHPYQNIGIMEYEDLDSFLQSFSYYFPSMIFNQVKNLILSESIYPKTLKRRCIRVC